MTEEQAGTARALLREGMDWIGMMDLSEEEEEAATRVQVRIQRLLEDIGELPRRAAPKRDRIEDCYRVVLSTRAQMERAERERDICRKRMNAALPERGRTAHYAIKRFAMAYSKWEEAERFYHLAEGTYCRALEEER